MTEYTVGDFTQHNLLYAQESVQTELLLGLPDPADQGQPSNVPLSVNIQLPNLGINYELEHINQGDELDMSTDCKKMCRVVTAADIGPSATVVLFQVNQNVENESTGEPQRMFVVQGFGTQESIKVLYGVEGLQADQKILTVYGTNIGTDIIPSGNGLYVSLVQF